ncbi:hypothetical protein pb186bvf_013781, partial [Paramecium bursaria]
FSYKGFVFTILLECMPFDSNSIKSKQMNFSSFYTNGIELPLKLNQIIKLLEQLMNYKALFQIVILVYLYSFEGQAYSTYYPTIPIIFIVLLTYLDYILEFNNNSLFYGHYIFCIYLFLK